MSDMFNQEHTDVHACPTPPVLLLMHIGVTHLNMLPKIQTSFWFVNRKHITEKVEEAVYTIVSLYAYLIFFFNKGHNSRTPRSVGPHEE